jgi:hypothetical protein
MELWNAMIWGIMINRFLNGYQKGGGSENN